MTRRAGVAGKLLLAVWASLVLAANASAQDWPAHPLHAGVMPPGAIGSQRLVGGGPLFCSPGFQPVQITAPRGSEISLAQGDAFGEPLASPVTVGLSLAAVYRLRVTNIPGRPGLEVFPTVEVIDRLAPPPGQELRFPIPIELTREELLMAARGLFVTRVIYLEDPQQATPLALPRDQQSWFEAPPGADPLMVADRLGRPVAILRLGGRIPVANVMHDDFFRGTPPWVPYLIGPQPSPTQPDAPASIPEHASLRLTSLPNDRTDLKGPRPKQ